MSGFLLDTYPASTVIKALFHTFASTGASVTVTSFTAADIEIYKDGSVTQRASDNGFTVTVDFDSNTGIHLVSIDLSDNSDASFYAVGSQYSVMVGPFTADSQTVNFVMGTFRIVAAEAIAGKPKVDVDAYGGSAGTFASGRPEVNVNSIANNAITAAAIAADAIGASELAADAVTEIQSGLATSSALSTAQTDITTIKGKTNSLTFTVAGQVDANIQYVNDVQVNGVGTAGNPWGP